MFMWELFNNTNSRIENKIIQLLKPVADRLAITFKSVTAEANELKARRSLSFEETVDYNNTYTIRKWLKNDSSSISHIRNKLARGFSTSSFKNILVGHAKNSWVPKLQKEFDNFSCPRERQLTRRRFKEEDEELSRNFFQRTISICFKILKSNGFAENDAIQFLSQPTILYNRVFCHCALFSYRSTQPDRKSIPNANIANDIKDIDYLFFSHHADHLFSKDKFMMNTFSHLKKSHVILKNTETGL